jgi:anti-anti-sigma factor
VSTEPGPRSLTGWDGHSLLLDVPAEVQAAGLTGWVVRGLENGEKVIYSEAGLASQASVLQTLRGHGVDVAAATADGRLVQLPVREFYAPGGHAGVVERAFAEGFRKVRLIAGASSAWSVLTPGAYLDYERAADLLCRTRAVSALCLCDDPGAGGRQLQDLVATHSAGILRRTADTGSQSVLALVGEVDLSNGGLVAAALSVAARALPGVFPIDLSQLELLAAAGVRALLSGTGQFRDAGGRVLLLHPAAAVSEVLDVTGIARVQGFEIVRGMSWR